MLNPNSYTNQTLTTFEILGGYLVDLYYNTMYEKAKERHASGATASLTEAYKYVCVTHLQHFGEAESFKETIKSVHRYFVAFKMLNILSYSEWVDQITRELVPFDFWESLPSNKKDHILGDALRKAFKNFCMVILRPQGLSMVIDNHTDKHNIPILQDEMINIMLKIREETYQIWTTKMSKLNSSDSLVEKIRVEFQKEIKKTQVLKTALKKASQDLKQRDQTIEAMREATEYLVEKAKTQQAEIDQLRAARISVPVSTPVSTPVPIKSPIPAKTPYNDEFEINEEDFDEANETNEVNEVTDENEINEVTDENEINEVNENNTVEDEISKLESGEGDESGEEDIQDIIERAQKKKIAKSSNKIIESDQLFS